MMDLAWQAQPLCFLGLIIIEVVQGIVPLGTALLTKALFDELAAAIRSGVTTYPTEYLLLLLLGRTILSVLGDSLGPVNMRLNTILTKQLNLSTQLSIYRKVNSLAGLAAFEDSRFHDTMDLAARGAQQGPQQALSISIMLFRNTVTIAAFAGTLISINIGIAIAIALAAVPQIFIQLKLGRQQYELTAKNSVKERRAGYYGHVLSSVLFAKEIRLFNLGDHFLKAWLKTVQEIHRSQHQQEARGLGWRLVLITGQSLIASGAFIAVVLQALAGRLSIGDVILYLSAVVAVQGALSSLAYAFSSLDSTLLFYSQYNDLLNLTEPLPLQTEPIEVPQLKYGVELRNVSFRYPDQQAWVLKDLNLFLPSGQCTAVIGLNGAGKSTLLKLLTRFYDPVEGGIFWDGIDIRHFDPQCLRHKITAVFQDFVHYELPMYDNIGLGNTERMESVDQIHLAASKAGIHDMIERLPGGYQTILSRSLMDNNYPGAELSGGEWQKVAIARMLTRDADLMILDEPTASLDAEAEHNLFEDFLDITAGRTSILITHRFSTVRMADFIVVLEDGCIKESGTHEELLSQKATYAKLYNMQAKHYLYR